MNAYLPRAAYGSMLTVEQPRPARSASESSLQSRVLQHGGQHVMHVKKVQAQDFDSIQESVRFHQRLATVKPHVSKDKLERDYQKYRKIVNMRQKYQEVVMPSGRPTKSSSSSCLLHQQDREQRRSSFEDRLENMLLRDWDGHEKKYEWHKYVASSRAAMTAASRGRSIPAASAAVDDDSLGKLLSAAGIATSTAIHLGPASDEQTRIGEQVGDDWRQDFSTCRAADALQAGMPESIDVPDGDCCDSAAHETVQTDKGPEHTTAAATESKTDQHADLNDVTRKLLAPSDLPSDRNQPIDGTLQNEQRIDSDDVASTGLQPYLQGDAALKFNSHDLSNRDSENGNQLGVGPAGGGPLKPPDFRSILNAAGRDQANKVTDPVNVFGALGSGTKGTHENSLLGVGLSKPPDFCTVQNTGSSPSMLGPSKGNLLGDGAGDSRLLKPPDFRSLLNAGSSSPSYPGISSTGNVGMGDGSGLKPPDFRTALNAEICPSQSGSNQASSLGGGLGDVRLSRAPDFRSPLNAGSSPSNLGINSSGNVDAGDSRLPAPYASSSEALKPPDFRSNGRSPNTLQGGGLAQPPDFRSILNGESDPSGKKYLNAFGGESVLQRDSSSHLNSHSGLQSVDITSCGLLKQPDFKNILNSGSGVDDKGTSNIGHSGGVLTNGIFGSSSAGLISNTDGSAGLMRPPAVSSMTQGFKEVSSSIISASIGAVDPNAPSGAHEQNSVNASLNLANNGQTSVGLAKGLELDRGGMPSILGGEVKASSYVPDGVSMGDNPGNTANEQASDVPSGTGSYVPSGMGSYVPSGMGGSSAPRRRRPRAGQL